MKTLLILLVFLFTGCDTLIGYRKDNGSQRVYTSIEQVTISVPLPAGNDGATGAVPITITVGGGTLDSNGPHQGGGTADVSPIP